MKRAILIGLLAILPATALGQTKSEAAEQNVVMQLNHLHQTPTLDELTKISPNARKIVERVALTSTGIGQSRAIEVLAQIGDDKARGLLNELLNRSGTRDMTQHVLVNALLSHFGDAELELAKTWLHSEDLQRRLTAIHGLGQIDSAGSLALLEAHLPKVKSAVEQNATLKALQHLR